MWRFLHKAQQQRNRDLDALRQDIDTDVHIKSTRDLLQSLQVDLERGLSTIDAKNRLRDQGPNALTPLKRTLEIKRILHRCCGGFSLLIWVAICELFNFSYCKHILKTTLN